MPSPILKDYPKVGSAFLALTCSNYRPFGADPVTGGLGTRARAYLLRAQTHDSNWTLAFALERIIERRSLNLRSLAFRRRSISESMCVHPLTRS